MTLRFAAVLVFLLGVFPPVFGQSIDAAGKQAVLDGLERTVKARAFVPGVDFARWPDHLAKQRGRIDAATEAPAFVAAVNDALRGFGISHIRLLTPSAARTRATGVQIGYGLATAPDPRGLVVTTVVPGSPADKLRIEPGDIVVGVEGAEKPRAIASLSPDGTERDTCLVTALRPSTGGTKSYMLLKKPFDTTRVPELTWPTKDIAMVRLASFTRGYDRRMLEGFLRTAAGAKGLILDLRGNGGGLVANLQHLLGLLAPEGTPTGTSVTRPMAERFRSEAGGDPNDMVAVAKWNGPSMKTRTQSVPPYAGRIAVLINGRSGSASEIVSAVLRERREAVLVGRRSAGAVLVSQFAPLRDGFEVQIPLSDYVTPGGMRLEKNGLVPDVEVEDPRRGTEDRAIPVAVKELEARFAAGKSNRKR